LFYWVFIYVCYIIWEPITSIEYSKYVKFVERKHEIKGCASWKLVKAINPEIGKKHLDEKGTYLTFQRYYYCNCNLIFSLLTEAHLHIHRKRRITITANRWILAIFQLGWIPSWISAAEHNATKGEELWVPIDEILQIFQLWINPCSRAQYLCTLHVNIKGFWLELLSYRVWHIMQWNRPRVKEGCTFCM
jgi:hypothetical protein